MEHVITPKELDEMKALRTSDHVYVKESIKECNRYIRHFNYALYSKSLPLQFSIKASATEPVKMCIKREIKGAGYRITDEKVYMDEDVLQVE